MKTKNFAYILGVIIVLFAILFLYRPSIDSGERLYFSYRLGMPEARTEIDWVDGKSPSDRQPLDYGNEAHNLPLAEHRWLITELPSDANGKSLYFVTINEEIQLWVGGKLHYQHDAGGRSAIYGRKWHIVKLPRDAAGQILAVHIYAPNPIDASRVEYMRLGSGAEQLEEVFIDDVPYIATLPLCLLLMLIMTMYSIYQSHWRRLYMWIAFFLAEFSLWTFAVSNVRQLIFDAPSLWWYIVHLMVWLMPISANAIVCELVDEQYRRGVRRIIECFSVIFLLGVITTVLDVLRYELMTVFFLFLLVAEMYVIYAVIRSAMDGNDSCRFLLLPVIAFTVLGVADGIIDHFKYLPQRTYLTPFGMFFFAIFVLNLLWRSMKREKEVATMADRLQNEAVAAERRMYVDALTGCYNRSRFDISMRESMALAEQTQEPLTMLLFDIDFFKRVNDKYGHDVGDIVLRGFAETVRSVLDREQFIRWGGEEFVVLCVGKSLDEATDFANLIRRRVKSAALYDDLTITCSVGVSLWHHDSAEAFFKRADLATYKSKTSGRNRVTNERELEN